MARSEANVLPPYRNPALPIEERTADVLDRMTLEEKVAQFYCIGRAVEMTGILLMRLGISGGHRSRGQ